MRALVIVLVMLSTALATAQPAGKAPPPDRREKIKQKIRALRAYTLTDQLDLDEATAGKLFPLLAKYDDELDKLLAQRADVRGKLEAATALKDNKAVDKAIDDAVANQRALWDAEARRLADLRKILTPQQVARTLIVLPTIERKIQNQLRKAIARRAGADDDGGDEDDADAAPARDFDKRKGRKRATGDCDIFSSPHGCK
jgi:Spy/CpxP family protein refolding chaperone